MKLYLVVGTRPDFIKIAPIIRTLREYKDIEYKVIHTGEHYDKRMSEVFFRDLDIPEPDVNFNMGITSHTAIGLMMSTFEEYCRHGKPDVVLVTGDVDSTRAIAIVVARMNKGIKLAHVEAGMRSRERNLPEEMNRKITDILSDYCFCTTGLACGNCCREGVDEDKVHLVGDTMIEQLHYSLKFDVDLKFPTTHTPYILVTLHRNYNVDDPQRLRAILDELDKIARYTKVIFPMHPRTKQQILSSGELWFSRFVDVREPLGYLTMLAYIRGAALVITDSGGIQVETSVLGVPCITVRNATEHVGTLRSGTNQLAKPHELAHEAHKILSGQTSRSRMLTSFADASKKIIEILRKN